MWSDLAALASEPLLSSHIAALHDLLRLAAAAEACGGASPPSPLYLQLAGLLAGLLSAAAPSTTDAFFRDFLKVSPSMHTDACQLACLAADLRLATLTDAASGGDAAAGHVQGVLADLCTRLEKVGPAVLRHVASAGNSGPEGEALYMAWLLEAVHCAVAYAASTRAPQASPRCGLRLLRHVWLPLPILTCPYLPAILQLARDPRLPNLTHRLAVVLTRTVAHGVFAFAAPVLGALADLQGLSPLQPQELELLLPALAACQQRPELAAAVSALVPALAHCPTLHTHVLQSALSGQSPLQQHLGMEAYRRYAKTCPPDNIMAALPPTMKERGGREGNVARQVGTHLQA